MLLKGVSVVHLHSFLNVSDARTQQTNIVHLLDDALASGKSHLPENKHALFETEIRQVNDSLLPSVKLMEELDFLLHSSESTESDPYRRSLNHTLGKERGEQVRVRRQLGVGLGVLSLGVSVYNAYQIHQLHNQIDTLNMNDKILFHDVSVNHQAIQVNSNQIEKIKRVMKQFLRKFSKNQYNGYIQHVKIRLLEAVHNHNYQILTWYNALTELMQSKLHPQLFDAEQLKQEYQLLARKVGEKGYILLSPGPAVLFTSPVSFYLDKSKNLIHFFVHVSLSKKTPLKLFRQLEIPMVLKGHPARVVDKRGDNILAVDDNGNVGLSLTLGDLSMCQKTINTYICPEQKVYRRNIQHTCLGALYIGDAANIETYCDIEFYSTPREESVQAINETSVVIFSSRPMHASLSCPPSKGTNIPVPEGQSIISIDSTCSLSTRNFIFSPMEDIQVDGEEAVLLPNLHLALDDILGDFLPEEMSSILTALDEIHAPGPRKLSLIRDVRAATTGSFGDFLHKLFTWIGIGVVLLLVLGIIAWLIRGYLRFRRQERQARQEEVEQELAQLRQQNN